MTNHMKRELQSALQTAAELLDECELEHQAAWFRDQLRLLQKNGSSSNEFRTIAATIRSSIAGMGSFSDLSLQPSADSSLTEKEARDRMWMLAAELDEITATILK